MQVIETPIKDLKIIQPKVFKDERGYFFESYNLEKLQELGFSNQFVQDNQSKSSYGVIRGLHYQLQPEAQTKLVRVFSGKIYDVAVDIRKNSPTFGQWFGVELSDENYTQLLIPKGFAHGFSVLSETAVVFYKCDFNYRPDRERGIAFNDKKLNIDWKIPANKRLVSERDRNMCGFDKAEMNF
ncbi:MAG: dTDP-4-dehydrorhamnose 3,5-epimerase [Bacteroidetes bacterium GWA2_31_9]|nr:MAG: dTDP-4-dehydrorhamnose 3,5-epimerase [Bacteroidetes bacterium GWA2_31_9]